MSHACTRKLSNDLGHGKVAKFEWKARLTLLWTSDVISSWLRRERNKLIPVKEKTATCGWEHDWKWQRGFLSMFEEQPLTFTTKSSNMLSATAWLWAWQSLGFFRWLWKYLQTSLPGGSPGEHLPGLPSSLCLHQNSPSLRLIPPNVALWSFLSLWSSSPQTMLNKTEVPPRVCFCLNSKTFLYHQALWEEEPLSTIMPHY